MFLSIRALFPCSGNMCSSCMWASFLYVDLFVKGTSHYSHPQHFFVGLILLCQHILHVQYEYEDYSIEYRQPQEQWYGSE